MIEENIENKELETENKNLQQKKGSKTAKVLLILSIILMTLTTIYLALNYVSIVLGSEGDTAKALGMIIFIVYIWSIIGGIGYGISLILSGIALTMQIVKKGKKTLYIIMTVMPIVLEALFYLLIKLA